MISIKKNLLFITWLIYLIPLSLVIGVLITEIIVFLICSLFIIYLFKTRDFSYLNSSFFKIFLFVYFFLLLNTIFSKDVLMSLKVSLPYIRYGLLSLAILLVYEKNKNFLSQFKYFIFPLLILLLIDGYYQYFVGKNILGYSTQSSRLSSFFFDEWILGSFLQKFYPLIILILFNDNLRQKYIYSKSIFLVLIYLLVFLSGERTAFFLLNFYLILIFYFGIKISKKLKNFLFIIMPLVIIVFVFSPVKERVFLLDKKIDFKDRIINFYDINYKYFHKTSFNIFLDNKFIGSGVKTFRVLCDDYFYLDPVKSCSTHPHNYYIQILAECGILGIVILLFIFIFLIANYIKLLLRDRQYLIKNFHQSLLLSGLIVYLWPITTSGNFFNNFVSIILFFNLGLFIKNINSNKL